MGGPNLVPSIGGESWGGGVRLATPHDLEAAVPGAPSLTRPPFQLLEVGGHVPHACEQQRGPAPPRRQGHAGLPAAWLRPDDQGAPYVVVRGHLQGWRPLYYVRPGCGTTLRAAKVLNGRVTYQDGLSLHVVVSRFQLPSTRKV